VRIRIRTLRVPEFGKVVNVKYFIFAHICGQVVACCQRFSMVLDSKLGCEAYLVYPEVEITSDVKGEEAKGRTFSNE
jgi:hypothetical protein